MEIDSGKRWLSVSQAADYLGVSRKGLYNTIERGLIPHSKVKGIGIRLDRYKLDRLLEQNENQSVAEQVESWRI